MHHHQKKLLIEKEYDIRARNGITFSPKDILDVSPNVSPRASLAPSVPHSPSATQQSPVKRFSPSQKTFSSYDSFSARPEPQLASPASPLTPKRTNYSPSLRKPTQSPYQLPNVTEPASRPQEPTRVLERMSSEGMRKSHGSATSLFAGWVPPSADTEDLLSTQSSRLSTSSPKAYGARSDFSPLRQADSISVMTSHFGMSESVLESSASSPLVTQRSPVNRGSPRHTLEPSSPVARRLSTGSPAAVPGSPSPISIPAPKSLFNANTSFAEKSIEQMYESEARETQSKRSLLWLAREFRARQEYDRASRYYTQLIDLYPVEEEVHFELGEIYHIALKEYRLAAQSYRRVLDKNPYHVAALVNLGLLHFDGLGAITDRYQAVKLWNRALRVDTRCVLALQCIAYCYYSGLGGLPISYVKARDFAELVLEYADTLNPMERTIASDAAYVLAHMYRRGYDTPRNYKRALAYYEKSATLGNYRAYVSIARMYQTELRDEEDAVFLYEHNMKLALKAEAAAQGVDYPAVQEDDE